MDFNTYKFVTPRDYAYYHRSIKLPFLYKVIEQLKSTVSPRGNSGQVFEEGNQYERQGWDIPRNSKDYDEFLELLNGIILKSNQQFCFDLTHLLDLYYFEYSPRDTTKLDWHMDIANIYPYNTRKLSFSLMVNDPKEYEGGELEIWVDTTIVAKIPKTPGGIAVFPSYMPHRVTPVTKGIRKVIVGFAAGKPFR